MAAANFTASFQPAVNAAEFVPRHHQRLPFKQAAKHHAITPQQHPSERLQRFVAQTLDVFRNDRFRLSQERPAAGEFDAGDDAMTSLSLAISKRSPLFCREEQGAQAFKTV